MNQKRFVFILSYVLYVQAINLCVILSIHTAYIDKSHSSPVIGVRKSFKEDDEYVLKAMYFMGRKLDCKLICFTYQGSNWIKH